MSLPLTHLRGAYANSRVCDLAGVPTLPGPLTDDQDQVTCPGCELWLRHRLGALVPDGFRSAELGLTSPADPRHRRRNISGEIAAWLKAWSPPSPHPGGLAGFTEYLGVKLQPWQEDLLRRHRRPVTYTSWDRSILLGLIAPRSVYATIINYLGGAGRRAAAARRAGLAGP